MVPYDNRETNHNFSGEIYIQFPSFGVQWLLVMIEGGTYDGNRETETIKNIDEGKKYGRIHDSNIRFS